MVDEYLEIRNLEAPLDAKQLRPLNPACTLVQFSSLPSERDLKKLAAFLEEYPSVTLRAYGGYDGSIRDLEFLRFFGHLRHFAADVYELDDISGLGYLPEDLESLALGATGRRHSLRILERFPSITRLALEGHTKDIDVLRDLTRIEALTLRSVTLPDLSLLLPLERLRSLDLKLGGTKDLRRLPEIGRLEYLELWLIRGLTDISAVSAVRTLRSLFLQALKRVEELPDLSNLDRLTHVHLETMKGVRDLTPLAAAPALTDLLLVDMPQLRVEHVACLAGHPTLRRASIGTGSVRRNEAIRERLGLGEADYEPHPELG